MMISSPRRHGPSPLLCPSAGAQRGAQAAHVRRVGQQRQGGGPGAGPSKAVEKSGEKTKRCETYVENLHKNVKNTEKSGENLEDMIRYVEHMRKHRKIPWETIEKLRKHMAKTRKNM